MLIVVEMDVDLMQHAVTLHKNLAWAIDHDLSDGVVRQQILDWAKANDFRLDFALDTDALRFGEDNIVLLDDRVYSPRNMALQPLDITDFGLEPCVDLLEQSGLNTSDQLTILVHLGLVIRRDHPINLRHRWPLCDAGDPVTGSRRIVIVG